MTATKPPATGPVAYLPEALTWRYEWADRWSFHGLSDQDLDGSRERSMRRRQDGFVALGSE